MWKKYRLFYFPEDTGSNDELETKKEEPKKEESEKKEPEKKVEDKIRGIPTMDGKGVIPDCTKMELVQLAQLGYDTLQKASKEEEEEEEPEHNLKPDDRIAKLEAQIREMREETKKKEQEETVIKLLDAEAKKYPITKNIKMKKSIEKELLATAATPGNRHDLPTLYKQIVEDRMEFMKETKDDNEKVNQFMNKTPRGGGGLPKIDAEEKYTPEDIKSGKAQRLLAAVLQKRLEEE